MKLTTVKVATGTYKVARSGCIIGTLLRTQEGGFEFRAAAPQCHVVWTFDTGRRMSLEDALSDVRAILAEIDEGERYPFELGGRLVPQETNGRCPCCGELPNACAAHCELARLER